MSPQIYLANVGANASHRFASPIFDDGTFEFLPIPEDRAIPGRFGVSYRDLGAYNHAGLDLLRYVPQRLWDRTAHYDPEFDSFTYGDNCSVSPRAASLKRIEPYDYLFFLSRMERWRDGKPTGTYGFYMVGYLEVERVVGEIVSRPDDGLLRRIRANAHVRRGLSDPRLWDRFWVFLGSSRSRRFRRAVPVTRELASRTFTSADGSPWRWSGGRTDLQVIGSYTRSCRCVIDSAVPEQARRADALWSWVAQHSS